MDIEKAKEFIRAARKLLEGEIICPYKFGLCKHDNKNCPIFNIDQALSLLDEPVCKTCKDTHQVGKEETLHGRSVGFKACPDCQQPPADYVNTQQMRHDIEWIREHYFYPDEPQLVLDRLLKAATRLDRLEYHLAKRGEAIRWTWENFAGYAVATSRVRKEFKRILGDEDFKEITK